MSSSTSELSGWYLFPIVRVFGLCWTACGAFLVTLFFFTGDFSLSIPVLVDFVSMDGFLAS